MEDQKPPHPQAPPRTKEAFIEWCEREAEHALARMQNCGDFAIRAMAEGDSRRSRVMMLQGAFHLHVVHVLERWRESAERSPYDDLGADVDAVLESLSVESAAWEGELRQHEWRRAEKDLPEMLEFVAHARAHLPDGASVGAEDLAGWRRDGRLPVRTPHARHAEQVARLQELQLLGASVGVKEAQRCAVHVEMRFNTSEPDRVARPRETVQETLDELAKRVFGFSP